MSETLLTVGDIARRERIPFHRVVYALKRANIEPRQRAGGTVRLFGIEQLPAIQCAIAAARGGSHGEREAVSAH